MPDRTDAPILGERFKEAFELAAELHRFHVRNGTTVPYLSHLMSVAALVLEDGGDEEEAIAALLHDALEDCGDRITAQQIEERFGRKVRSLVEACTDTPPDFTGGSKPPWRERKEVYISLVADGHGNRISLADKLHNARAILRDHRANPAGVWDRFAVEKDETLWYYDELVQAYRKAGTSGYLMDELNRVVRKLHARDRDLPDERGGDADASWF